MIGVDLVSYNIINTIISDNERDDIWVRLFSHYPPFFQHTFQQLLLSRLFMIHTALFQADAGYTGSDGWSWYTFFVCFFFGFRFLDGSKHCTACNDLAARWYTRVFLFGFYFW